jgi:hypothetical protein
MAFSLLMVGAGCGTIRSYVVFARKELGIRVDPVQALLYRIDSRKLTPSQRMKEFWLRMLKHFGFLLAVISAVQVFAEI